MPASDLPPSSDSQAPLTPAPGEAPAASPEPSTAPARPVPPTRWQRARRAARRTVRWSLWSLLGGVVLLALAIGGLWAWSARDQSLATVVRIVQGYLPATMSLQAEGVSGTVRHGGHIERLVYTRTGTDADGYTGGTLVVTLDRIDVAWELAALWDRATRFSQVHARTVTWQDTRVKKPLTSPTQPLQSLTLPIGVELPFSIDTLRLVGKPQEQADIRADTPAEAASAAASAQRAQTARTQATSRSTPPAQVPASPDTVVTQLRGRYRYDRLTTHHQLQIDALTLAQGHYRAALDLQGAAPMALQAQASAVLDLPASANRSAQRLLAALGAAGTLSGTDALLAVESHVHPVAIPAASSASAPGRAHTTAAAKSGSRTTAPDVPTQLDLRARLFPWQTQPIASAQAQWQALDLQAFWPAAPRTRLQGLLDLQPLAGSASAASGASPTATTPGMLGALGPAHWQLKAQITNQGSGAWDRGLLPLDRLDTLMQYRAGSLDMTRLAVQIAKGQIEGHGSYRPRTGWLGALSIRHLDPALFDSHLAAAPISGTIEAHSTAAAAASAQAPIAFEARLASDGGSRTARRAADRQLALDTVTVQGSWNGQVLDLPTLDMRAFGATLQGHARYTPASPNVSGRLALALPGATAQVDGALGAIAGQGTLRATITDLHRLSSWLTQWPGTDALRRQTLTGQATLDARWTGGWQNQGRALQLKARLAAPTLSMQAQSPATAPRTEVRQMQLAASGPLSRLVLQASAEAQQATRHLTVALDGTAGLLSSGWAAHLHATRLLLREDRAGAAPWTATLTQPVTLDLTRDAQTLDLRTGAWHVVLAGAASGQPRLDADPLHFRLQGQSYTLSSKGRLADVPLSWLDALSNHALSGNSLAGDMVLAGQWDAQLDQGLHLTATLARSRGDLVVLGGSAGTGARMAAGVRDARLTLQGSGNALHAALHWDSANAGTADLQLATRLVSQSGGWSLPGTAPVQGTIRADLPQLGIWSMFAPPGWRLRGTLQARATVGGTLQSPTLQGTLNADELGVRSVVDGIEFNHGTLRTRLSDNRLDIDTFTLQGAPQQGQSGGSLRISGNLQWGDGGQPLLHTLRAQLATHLDRLQLSTLSDRQIVLSGDMQTQLAALRLTMRGALRVDHAYFVLPTDTAPSLDDDVIVLPSKRHPRATQATARDNSSTSSASTTTPAQTAPSSGSASAQNNGIVPDIHVTLDMGDDLRVRGRGLDTRLRGQLTIDNGPTLNALPRLNGTIRTDRGTFRAYGQELTISSGRLIFTGAASNPTLDISAVRPNLSSDVQVGVRVRGTAQHPTVQLFSDPEMTEPEKLSWLVLGRSSSSTADTALLQQAALALLAGQDGKGLTGELADALGLDQLSFGNTTSSTSSSSTTSSGLAGSSVTLGKHFSRNFSMAYERSLDATMGTLYFFYDLTRHLKLRGETGTESAISLIYTISYDHLH